jgi:hypothetical protein
MDLDLTIRYLDDLTALNVTVPAKAIDAADVYRAALAAAGEAPAADLQAALVAGKLNPKNIGGMVREAALAQAAQQNAHQVVASLRLTINKVIRDALREDRDRIITELRKGFDPAAAEVAKAAEHFGPGTTAEDIVTARPDVVKKYNQLAAHVTTLDLVSRAYRTLLSDVLRELPDDIATLFVADAEDLGTLRELYRSHGSWLALAHAGYTLRLNTPNEAAALVARAEAKAAELAKAEHDKAVEANRHRHRFDLRAMDGAK